MLEINTIELIYIALSEIRQVQMYKENQSQN